MGPTLLEYADAFAAGSGAVGGKAWTVARLRRYGFRVPDGAAVPVEVYDAFMAAAGLAEQAAALWARTEAGAPALEALRSAIAGAPPFAPLRDALAGHPLASRALAVRSSAVGEDGQHHSFAGIHDSVLHVEGVDAICAAVQRVWASVWTEAGFAYRRHHGLGAEPRCGVLLCAMVPADAAGVAFTCDPIAGDRDVVVIEAVRGFGDQLVAGAAEPERWRIDLRSRPLQPDRTAALAQPVLTGAQAEAVAAQAERAMWALGDGTAAQDLEWVWHGGAPWLVQARPVTNPPVKRLAGTEQLPRVWSDANVVDSVPGVLSTSAWFGLKMLFEHIILAPYALSGYPVPPGLETLRRFDGRVLLDATVLQWISWDALDMPPEDLNRALGGHQKPLEVGRASLGQRVARAWRGFRLMQRVKRYHRGYETRAAEVRAELLREAAADRGAWTDARLAEAMESLAYRALEESIPFIMAGMEAGTVLLRRLLQQKFGEAGDAVAAGLMAGAGGVVSAEQAFRIHDLAEAAAAGAAARTALEAGDPVAACAALPDSGPFRGALTQYLDDFGHRAVYEAELEQPRWSEDPSYVLAQVRALLEAGLGRSPRAAARAVRERAEAKLKQLWFPARWQARIFARLARAAAARRENAKSTIVAFSVPWRALYLEAGRRLTAAGHLDAPDEAFQLATHELVAGLRGETDPAGFRGLAADRRAWREAMRARPAPQLVVEEAGELSVVPAGQVAQGASVGTGASPGVAEAVARVIAHPEEGGVLQAGEILVAPSTDPGWTPLFLRAGGLVMENGGYLSHGAVVARELGIPAVINVAGAMERFAGAPRLRIDGGAGTIDEV